MSADDEIPAATECCVGGDTLVIGLGNRERSDDGVGFEVINALRRRLGEEELDEEEIAILRRGREFDVLMVQQLGPEWLEVTSRYSRLVFVDAHVDPNAPELLCRPVFPEYAPALFTHHMPPAMFLALLQALHQRQPRGFLVSIHGRRFDLGRGLSEEAASQIRPAVETILGLLAEPAAAAS